ncbi:MAG: ATP-binding cassette domain-containing protein [Gammaproteobacteria bacterium]|nr:MAG: ATP-binding cassette domain-containing protein [Gammaproteobacteria bacterium]
MDSTALVAVENLSRYYQKYCAIDQLSFSLQAGEVLGFLGPNGAGKSTTMQVITGNLAPSEGRVIINGFDIIESPRQAKQHMGYLPEHPPIYREATVDEYLKYCAKLRRIEHGSIANAMEESKSHCGLLEVGHRLIANLSKGYQQRVGIAQAIIHNPAVVILDEPTVGLDPIQIREIRSLIKTLGADRSVILSTHILSEVQASCDRVLIIREGKLIYSASIETLKNYRNKHSITAAFSNPPPIEQLEAISLIEQVESIDNNRFRLSFNSDSPAESLVQASVKKKWGLFELVPDHTSLEDLFIELTQDENAGVDSAEAEG